MKKGDGPGPWLPNIGREPHSFLTYIVNYYEDIADDSMYAFVQGNPFDHCPTILSVLEGTPSGQFMHLGKGDLFMSEGDGRPHHGGLPVKELYEKWLRKTWPGQVGFTPGGQFMLSGKQIKQRPKSFYEMLLSEVAEGQNCYVLERLWFDVFHP